MTPKSDKPAVDELSSTSEVVVVEKNALRGLTKIGTMRGVIVHKEGDKTIAVQVYGGGASGMVVVDGNEVPIAAFRTEVLIDQVGSVTEVAELMGVAKSQPTRWRKGKAVPSPDKARMLTDLEHVFSRAALIFEPSVTKQWMTGSNDYLEGARPIDVLKTRGVSEVLDALDAAEQIAYGG